MKISTALSFIVVIAGIFWIFSSMTNEANQLYPDAHINNTEWATKYDMSEKLNSTLYPLQHKFEVIQDEKQGFFTKLAAGITAIPYAVIVFPQAAFEGCIMLGKLASGLLTTLGIPGKIIILVILLILIWVITKLLGFFQRSDV